MKYMKYLSFPVVLTMVLILGGCASAPPPPVYNARLYTVDNETVDLRDVHVYEEDYRLKSQEFRARWRQSLNLESLPFAEIASAERIDDFETVVQFRDGHEDTFTDFFVDEYNLIGWSDYGPIELNATLLRGLVFTDDHFRPVLGDRTREITPIVHPPKTEDRFITFDGDIVSGRLEKPEFTINTSYGKLNIDRELITDIMVDREGETLQQIVKLKNGDIISGFLEPSRLTMKISGDQEVTLDVDQLSRVRFSRPVALEEAEER